MPRPNITPEILSIKAGPGESRNATLSIREAPADTRVIATIKDGGGLVTLKEVVAFEKSVRPMTDEEINELPPFPKSIREKARREGVVDYTEFGRTDGITPLSVPWDASVEFHLEFLASPQSIPNLVNASLVITGATWDRVEVPIHFLVGKAITIPAVAPDKVNFIAEPGQAQTYDVIIASAPSSTTMLAYVEDGGPIIGVQRAIAFRTVKKAFTQEEINELPPSMRDKARRDGYLEFQEAARSLGSTPLAVEKGQLVKISVEFAPPLQGFPDGATATLVIDAPVWQSTQVPLSLIIGKIAVSLSTDSITAKQGLGADMTVTLTSVAGPATDVNLGLGMGSDQWRVVPNVVHLPRANAITVPVKVVPSARAPFGTFPVGFEVRSFEQRQFLSVPFQLTVITAAVTVRLLQPDIVLSQGGRATCQVEVWASGYKLVTFHEGTLLPDGISMPQVQGAVGLSTPTVVVPLEIIATADARTGANQLVSIQWSAGDGANEGFLTVPLTVNRVPDSRTFQQTITTPPGTALGGSVELTIRNDGTYSFNGRMRGSGLDPYAFRISAVVRGADGTLSVAALKSGTVGGTFGGGSRETDWQEPGHSASLELFWPTFRDGRAEFNKWYSDTGVLGGLEEIATALTKMFVGGYFFGPTGVAVVLGSELAALTGIPFAHPTGLAAAVVAGGIVVFLGPGVLLPAMVAGIAAGAQLKTRRLRDSEKEFAATVFGDTLPIDRILVTNLSRGTKQFCIPNIDGSIILGLGGANDGVVNMYDDPLRQPDWKHIFVHELTHSWQISHGGLFELIWQAAINETRSQGQVYYAGWKHGFDGREWSGYGFEEQAEIVATWFSHAHSTKLSELTAANQSIIEPVKLDSFSGLQYPAFRYVQNNIRLGQP
jgi:hypothetical protein